MFQLKSVIRLVWPPCINNLYIHQPCLTQSALSDIDVNLQLWRSIFRILGCLLFAHTAKIPEDYSTIAA